MHVDNSADTDEMCRRILKNQIIVMEALQRIMRAPGIADYGEAKLMRQHQEATKKLLEQK